MSFCKTKLYFGGGSDDRNADLDASFNFGHVDDSDDTSMMAVQDVEMTTSPLRSDIYDKNKHLFTPNSQFRDSGLDTPTPENGKSGSSAFGFSPRVLSPIPLNLEDSEEEQDEMSHESTSPGSSPRKFQLHVRQRHSPPSVMTTPPHKKLRKLRLNDTPHTPKTLLQKAQRRITRANRQKLSAIRDSTEKCVQPAANVNPFNSPDSWDGSPQAGSVPALPGSGGGVKRSRQFEKNLIEESAEETDEDNSLVKKKLALHDINTSRYNEEFHQLCKLGDGEFGSVFKCVHRLDGCTYAIKKSKKPVAGSVYERNALNEVYAHAVLGKHPHVVRYYSAWAENDHMYIQNEYCNGGSLADHVHLERCRGRKLSEDDLRLVLIHLVHGLKYIHSQNLVHLDIKPGNIFIHHNPLSPANESGIEEDLEDEDTSVEPIMYKIGDLGHVTSVTNPKVEEGDCRFLPREILRDQFDSLPKADIFSLALTIYAAGTGEDLPKNGDAWHAIRQGELPPLPQCSPAFNNLLKSMVHPDQTQRPSAFALAHHPVLFPVGKKSKAQLKKELNEERFKNQVLSRKLKEATQKQTVPVEKGKSSRLVGRKVNRSMSLQCF